MKPNIHIGLRAAAGYLASIEGPADMQNYCDDLAHIMKTMAINEQDHAGNWAPENPYRDAALHALYGFLSEPGDDVTDTLKAAYREAIDWLKTESFDFEPIVRVVQ